MATYQHGVYNQEQATSLTTPIRSSAALQVIFGTAPVHLADDPTKAANTLKLCYSFAECQAAVGYSDDFKNFTLCQSIDANFRVFNNAPIVLVNVLDPGNSKHTKNNGEESCAVTNGQAVYKKPYVEKRIFARLTNKDLPFKGARQKKKTKHIRRMKSAAKGDSIEKRPEEVNTRQEPGHWEMDLVVSCRGGHKCLMALTERVTRQEIMRLIPDKSAASVVRAMNTLERKYGKMFPEVFKTITVDNGTEFSNCEGMETSIFKAGGQRTKVYYCHPYCSSERGSNEKQNQMIRRKFPKGTNFDRVSPKEVRMVEDWLNRYPRKILGWYSSADLFNQIFGGV